MVDLDWRKHYLSMSDDELHHVTIAMFNDLKQKNLPAAELLRVLAEDRLKLKCIEKMSEDEISSHLIEENKRWKEQFTE